MGTRRVWPTLVGLFVVVVGLPLASPGPVAAAGSVSLTAIGSTYTEDFNTLATTGTTNTALPTGWDLIEAGGGARDNEQYAADTGGSNTGDTYSYGAASSTERAFGALRSGTLIPTNGTSFTNNTGVTVGAVGISYTGEMWRAGVASRGAADRIDFQLSTNATSLTTGTWTDYDVLDFSSPNTSTTVGAKDGNTSGFRTSISATVAGLAIADGATFWIRWTDFDISSSDDGLAVDDFSLTPYDVDSPPAVSATSPLDGATGVLVGDNVSITFSEPVSVAAGWYDVSCTTSGNHTAAVSGGPSTFTINPDTDFAQLETCTVTVHAAQVSDQDANDPPDKMAADYVFNFDTEGNVCTLPFTPIFDIQGSGNSAAITGNVTTQGVVVGDFEGPTSAGLQGFYLQDATGDGDPQTSDGIFVFSGNTDNGLAAGDVVRVTGYARERFGQTSLNGSNSDSSAVSSANILGCGETASIAPVDVTLPFANATYPERYEGMLVDLPQQLVISEYFNYDRFGELVLAKPLDDESRAYTPTLLEQPGAPAIARAEANLLSRITLDDGLGSQNPPTLRHLNGDPFSLSNRFRGGDEVANTVGVMGFDFSRYRIQPTGPADYTVVNPRTPAPEPVGGHLRVAALNTLNFFITPDYPSGPNDNKCGPAQNVECRGWDSDQPTELTRQRDKLIRALAGLGSDVIGLNELENTTGVDPLGDPTNGVVAGLNALLGGGTYAYIDTGVVGTDAIRVGMIYKPASVTPVGAYQTLTSADDPRFIDTKSRPALAQTFRENSSGAVFTLVVNHLKSKGSDCNDLGDPDTGDGQGNCNATRTLAAQALVDWLATDPTGSGDPDFLIMGDLNSYAMEDPISAIKTGADDTVGTGDDFTNLISQYVGPFGYSYVFDGQAGYLDHALSNPSMTAQVTGVTEWHINADEPDVLDYDTSFKPPAQDALYEANAYRTSDHDPVVVGLNLTANIGKVTGSGTWADGSFNFSAQFLKGASVPTGTATFGLPSSQTLVASSYQWLSLSGNRATFQGSGSINGNPGYGFLVSVLDGGSPPWADRIRIKVWDADGNVVYDSQPGAAISAVPSTALTSGNLVVHKPK